MSASDLGRSLWPWAISPVRISLQYLTWTKKAVLVSPLIVTNAFNESVLQGILKIGYISFSPRLQFHESDLNYSHGVRNDGGRRICVNYLGVTVSPGGVRHHRTRSRTSMLICDGIRKFPVIGPKSKRSEVESLEH
jgi:hypothetical protein